MIKPDALERILDLGRWAPSGDNTQPWRFEIIAPDRMLVHGFDTREHCVYDINGHPSQIALGALLETLAIAASAEALGVRFRRRPESPDTNPVIEIDFHEDQGISASPLLPYIEKRSVQRRMMSTKALEENHKRRLADALGSDYSVAWFESFGARLRLARLLFRFANLRLTMPEAYRVHRSVIAWNSRYSEDKVPDQAIGLDPMTLSLMRWVMRSWQRVAFFNRFLAGSLVPRLELDLVPGVACAGHFAIVAQRPAKAIDDYISAGRALQRFWLTAASLGLALQPEMTPLIFSGYVRASQRFSAVERLWPMAERLASELHVVLGSEIVERAVFLGRIGRATPVSSRSLRLPVGVLKQPTARAGVKD